jgi:hypothetical protein
MVSLTKKCHINMSDSQGLRINYYLNVPIIIIKIIILSENLM